MLGLGGSRQLAQTTVQALHLSYLRHSSTAARFALPHPALARCMQFAKRRRNTSLTTESGRDSAGLSLGAIHTFAVVSAGSMNLEQAATDFSKIPDGFADGALIDGSVHC